MSKQRKHTVSIHKSVYHDVNTGAYAALGGPFYIKKLLGKAHYLVRASDAFYHEVSPACFEATLKNSKHRFIIIFQRSFATMLSILRKWHVFVQKKSTFSKFEKSILRKNRVLSL